MIPKTFLALTLLGAASALAQPAPRLTALTPEWVQRGTTVEIVLTGDNLSGVTGFLFDGDPGLSATNVPPAMPPKPAVTIESASGGITLAQPAPVRDNKRLVTRVTAAADAALTARELRVVSAGGVSNPLLLNVGQLPEIAKRDPNDTLETAQTVTLPAVISGLVNTPGQFNYYRFKARAGEELVFEIDAARRGSPLDSSLVLLDVSGKELARSEDALGLDSLLFFTAPAEGEYVLQLRDFRYQGGNNFSYRLYAGALPYIQSVFPLGAQRGKTVEIALQGRNIDGTTKLTLNIDAKTPRGRQDIRAATPRGYSNPIGFDVQETPDFAEAEPNDAPDKANAVTPPVTINGRIGAARDLDRFKFKAAKDERIVCEVTASRFGSKLDALLILSDASGAVLQQNDDAAEADARLEFDAKKDTEYTLALRDLTDRGGDAFAYRLTVRPPSAAAEASFTAAFLPDVPRVHRGGLTRLRCEVTRQAGFDGPVRFELINPPTGLFAEPLILPAGLTGGFMPVSASADAPLGSQPLRVRATAQIAGRMVTRPVQPQADRPVRQSYLTVLEAAPFTLEAVTLSAAAEQDQSTAIEVFALRREEFAGEIKLVAEGFAAGREPITKNFSGGETVLKATNISARLKLTPRTDSEVGTRTVMIRGESTVNGVPVVQYTRPVPVTVTQIPFLILPTLTNLTVTAVAAGSTSSAGETATAVRVERRAGFAGEVALTVEGAPTGLTLTLDKIPASSGESTLKIVATDKAPTGTNLLTIIGTGLHQDRNYKYRSKPVTLIVSAPEPTEPPPAPAATAAAAKTP